MATTNYGKALLLYKKNASGMQSNDTNKAVEGKDSNAPNSDGPLSSVEKFFSDDPVNADNSWKVIQWDCVISEGHRASNQVTKYPIQSGFMVSDHAIRENRILKLRGVIVNVGLVPKGLDAMVDLAAKAGGAILGTGFGSIVSSAITKAKYLFSDESARVNKVKNTFDELEKLCLTGTFVHATTILGNYMNCIIRDVEVVQDAKTSSVLIVDLTLEEMQVQYYGTNPNAALAKELSEAAKDSFKWKSYASALGINTAVVLGGL